MNVSFLFSVLYIYKIFIHKIIPTRKSFLLNMFVYMYVKCNFTFLFKFNKKKEVFHNIQKITFRFLIFIRGCEYYIENIFNLLLK